MESYKANLTYYSTTQQRVLEEGEVFSVSDAKIIMELDESIKKLGSVYLTKLESEDQPKSKRGPKKKEVGE